MRSSESRRRTGGVVLATILTCSGALAAAELASARGGPPGDGWVPVTGWTPVGESWTPPGEGWVRVPGTPSGAEEWVRPKPATSGGDSGSTRRASKPRPRPTRTPSRSGGSSGGSTGGGSTGSGSTGSTGSGSSGGSSAGKQSSERPTFPSGAIQGGGSIDSRITNESQDPRMPNAIRAAQSYWGGYPSTRCASVTVKDSPLSTYRGSAATGSGRSNCVIEIYKPARDDAERGFCQTVVHEFGHLAGRGHTSDRSSIMSVGPNRPVPAGCP